MDQAQWQARLPLIIFIMLLIPGISVFALPMQVKFAMVFLDYLPSFMQAWLLTVEEGVNAVESNYPFLLYGFDWLAYGHVAIAIFFIPAIKNPTAHITIINSGIIICTLMIPFVLVSGAVRYIPFWWRAGECIFAIIGILLLLYTRKMVLLKLKLSVGNR